MPSIRHDVWHDTCYAIAFGAQIYPLSVDHIGSVAATIGGAFFVGILIGYALKKVVKIAAVIVGLFFAGLAYLRYQQ